MASTATERTYAIPINQSIIDINIPIEGILRFNDRELLCGISMIVIGVKAFLKIILNLCILHSSHLFVYHTDKIGFTAGLSKHGQDPISINIIDDQNKSYPHIKGLSHI